MSSPTIETTKNKIVARWCSYKDSVHWKILTLCAIQRKRWANGLLFSVKGIFKYFASHRKHLKWTTKQWRCWLLQNMQKWRQSTNNYKQNVRARILLHKLHNEVFGIRLQQKFWATYLFEMQTSIRWKRHISSWLTLWHYWLIHSMNKSY